LTWSGSGAILKGVYEELKAKEEEFAMFIRNWTSVVVGVVLVCLSSLAFGGSWELIYKSDPNSDIDLYAIQFVSPKEGWAVGGKFTEDKGIVLHTTDGGKTWQIQENPAGHTLWDLCFLNNSLGWAVGADGTIIMTKDGGKTWKAQISKVQNWLYGVTFLTPKLGYAVGMGETILRTRDGRTWKILKGGKPPSGVGEGEVMLSDVCFVNEKKGWTVGQNGEILHTEDGGRTWKPQTSGLEQMAQEYNLVLWGVHFINELKGWAVGDYGIIIHTEDGGKTWTRQKSPTEESLKDVYFLPNGKEGWAVGTMGTILHTTDGGKTWVKEDWTSPTRSKNYEFRGLSVLDPKHCWITGEWGFVLRYKP